MAELKTQLKADLVSAMKAGEDLRKSTLRMALAAIANEEVAGKTARELTQSEELAVLTKEVARRKDSAEAYAAGKRPELEAKELAEADILAAYLPAALADDELLALVAEEVAKAQTALGEPVTIKQMGMIVKAVSARASGRADGGRIAGFVRATLA